MKKGILIYKKSDYEKNSWFAKELVKNLEVLGCDTKIILYEDIKLSIFEGEFFIIYKGEKLKNIDFAINRSRDFILSNHLEKANIKVFNNAKVTEICNNKLLTHQFINSKEIACANTFLVNKERFSNKMYKKFPYVVKSADGHGGSEVFKVNDEKELVEAVKKINDKVFLIQEFIEKSGKDVRVFVVGGKIIASILRYSKSDFKANFSLGGSSKVYELKDVQKNSIEKICNKLYFDFVGIDFLVDENNNFYFNEIEDVVGSRTLYENCKDIDIAKIYCKHIIKNLL